ncbi:HpcH/HpaI aldolase/citrate lyase family protein [Streptomyces sp. NPDC057638]|uniref:HpcH/HpaI aldolase family protein n=1 Tax=Streptomyces sp. NPDC057638 TaxID=3346190 RepID=UPI0036B37A2F
MSKQKQKQQAEVPVAGMDMAGVGGFVGRLRGREVLVGYWVAVDHPVVTERLGRLGFDYVGVDGQHGVLGVEGWQTAMLAVDAGGVSAGLIRVPSVDPVLIGAALDVGARGVIVPMVESAAEALVAVRACRHAPVGTRSVSGPVRGALRLGEVPGVVDEGVACVVMVETRGALEELEGICGTPGLDAVYVGPADLSVALGGRWFGDPLVEGVLEEALERVVRMAERFGIGCGIHVADGESAARRLAQGFTFATVSSDLTHVEQAAAAHLAVARAAG